MITVLAMSFPDSPDPQAQNSESITIDCDTCIMKATPTCNDCVVTYLCERPVEHAVVVNLSDFRAMKALAEAGLVPTLRHQEQTN